MKITIAIILLTLALLIPTPTKATHGFGSYNATVYVNGQIFTIGGYAGDTEPSFRLMDIAYILNGTSAQFSIQEPPDDRWDFWIVRGEEHTPTGDEFTPIPERWVVLGSYGFVQGHGGIGPDFSQSVIVGIDGGDYPSLTVALGVIVDDDDMYFSLFDIANLVGFTLEMWGSDYNIVIEPDPTVVRDVPNNPVEFVRLLSRITGHWVDYVHYYGETIDESVVWPVEFLICVIGFREFSGWPIAPFRHFDTEWIDERYAVHMQTLENGYVQITIDPNRQVWNWRSYPWPNAIPSEEAPSIRDVSHLAYVKIVVDPTQPTIETLTFYIGDTAHTMVRYSWDFAYDGRDSRRYYAIPAEGGGITLRYVLGASAISAWNLEGLRIYRSTVHNEDGEVIYTHTNLQPTDRILFEFTDTTATSGNVYYYSIAMARDGRSFFLSPAGGSSQMRVDTIELLGQPEVIDEPQDDATDYASPSPHHDTTSESYIVFFCTNPGRNSILYWFLPVVILAVIVAFAVVKRKL